MSKESVINLDPWNNNNHLLTEEHVYHIFENKLHRPESGPFDPRLLQLVIRE